VQYKKAFYPGYVESSENNSLYCECMHAVGRKKNIFYWPKKFRDKNWYYLEEIVAVIPKPETIKGSDSHFCVEENVWNKITLSKHIC